MFSKRIFEFDAAKSAANLTKHGIDFVTAQKLWQDNAAITLSSVFPEEVRWMRIAKLAGKCWTAIYTVRGKSIRIISVRRSRKEEQGLYEKQN